MSLQIINTTFEQTKTLVQQSNIITDRAPEEQEIWLEELGKHLKGWGDVQDLTVMVEAEILYTVWSLWDASHHPEGRSLSAEALSMWNYDFYTWAKAFTKRRADRVPAEITIDNKISTFKDWEAEGVIECPEYVYIPKRDIKGYLVDEDLTKEESWERVEFNFRDCDYGKLLNARAAAKEGRMTPEAWSALRDPHATVNTLLDAIKGDRNKKKKDDFFITEENGIIYGCTGERRRAVMMILFENEGDELFSRTLCHALHAMGIKVPLEYQHS